MRYWSRIFVGYFLIMIPWVAWGQVFQNVWVENFDNRNGLTQNTVWDILQDHSGFLWLGTDDGLLRYDGYQFKVYRSVIGKIQNGLASNSVRYLYQNQADVLWIGTPNGLSRLHLPTDSLRSFLRNVRVRRIAYRDSSSLWLATNKGLYYFNTTNSTFFCKAPNLNVLNVIYLNPKRLLFTTAEKTWVLDLTQNRYYPILKELPEDPNIRPIILENNVVWIGVEDFGLWKVDAHTLKIVKKYDLRELFPKLTRFPVREVFKDRAGKIWVSIHEGIFCFNPTSEKLEFLASDLDYRRLNSLKGAPLNSIYEDKTGLFWVGSNNSGLNKINLRLGKFRTINQDQGLNYNFVLSFGEFGNQLLIGTDGKGINLWNRNTNQFEVIQTSEQQQNRVFSMVEGSHGVFWCATARGLIKVDVLQKKILSPLPHERELFEYLSQSHLRTLYKDSRQRLWVGSVKGLVSYDFNTHRLQLWPHANQAGDIVTSFKEDKEGNIWIGRGIGLQKYVAKSGLIESVPLMLPKTQSKFEDLSDVNIQGDSILWLSSYRVGFGKYNLHTKHLKLYTPAEGLANSIVYGSLMDSQGYAWISTNTGLSRFDPVRETFTNFDVYDGLQNNEFIGGSFLLLKNGEMVFGGVNGFNIFRPQGLQRNSNQSPVAITDVKVMNESVGFERDLPLIIDYKNNFVSFEFAALDFAAPQKNQYAYQLEGIDKKWIYSGSRHFVSYSQLPAGDYIFKVKASNSAGEWNETPTTLRLRVVSPFWVKDWFKTLMIVLGVIGIVFFFTNRIRFIKEREKEKINLNRQIAELEMKALRAQMNPHFIFNCLNSINNFILHDQNRQASKYLTKFAKLIRQILDNTDTPLASVERIVNFMNLYIELEQMRFVNNRFDFEIEIDPLINAHETVFPTMMIQPHVENAIWHGLMHKAERGKISLKFCRENKEYVSCIIEDNGIGRIKAREIAQHLSPSRKSKGTQNVLDSIETFNRQHNTEGAKIIIDDLYDTQQQPTGTRVKIILPDLAQQGLKLVDNGF